MLAELAELIATTLNASDPGKWGTYKVPGYVSAENCLDPEVVRQSSTKRLLVMPLFTDLNMDGTLRRGRMQSIQPVLNLSLTLLIPFEEFSTKDVTHWNEVKNVLDLRERLDLFIMRTVWGEYNLNSVNPMPPVEIELNQRNFLSSTEFTFSTQIC